MYQSFINQLPVICHQQGVEDIIISPGSRSAPLTLAFARYKKFTVRMVVDERSAAFIALGIAQQKRKPVVLICTSGTAVLNYAPAVAEAFFQKIPLLILTADRPPELIGRQDGQTIYQENVFGKHVKAFYQLPDHFTKDDKEPANILAQALNRCCLNGGGPVHINIPLREPLYEPETPYPEKIETAEVTAEKILPDFSGLTETLQSYSKILIAAASLPFKNGLAQQVEQLIQKQKLVWLADITSNLRGAHTQNAYDFLLGQPDEKIKQTLRPEVLITVGDNHVSKNLKLFLKTHKPLKHFHFTLSETAPDTFQANVHHLRAGVETLLSLLDTSSIKNQEAYYADWNELNSKATFQLNEYLTAAPFGEFSAVNSLLREVHPPAQWQLANSMPVRYANYIPIHSLNSFYSNLGTSGIDGSMSTAAGAALAVTHPVFLLTGDLSFLYDEHALWNDFVPPNLRILVINNGGGGIFRLIDGPRDLPEREELFSLHNKRSIREVAHHYGLHYHRAANAHSLEGVIAQFYHPTSKAIMAEIITEPETDIQVFQQFKKLISI
ncbi:MAG: 2-succinyl-5-enolpyruvyl-6-hydroxy-3-cyclohexene-1-carboxylic-acid synthase [Bacteroidia bacterium]|nr:2-succinyl-5-enolpyruvyl-6-hydroxy-3-cyclohexene-1-carboxylic-acid synthase [Bacteroidia bacterium]